MACEYASSSDDSSSGCAVPGSSPGSLFPVSVNIWPATLSMDIEKVWTGGRRVVLSAVPSSEGAAPSSPSAAKDLISQDSKPNDLDRAPRMLESHPGSQQRNC